MSHERAANKSPEPETGGGADATRSTPAIAEPRSGQRRRSASGGGSRAHQETQTGAVFDPQHGVRPMKVYPISESDMLLLQAATALASIFWSFGLVLIGYGVEIHLDASFSGPLSAKAEVLANNVEPICFVIGALLLLSGIGLGLIYWLTWRRVKKSTIFKKVVAGSE